MSKKKIKTAPFLIFCLVFLFNPNIHVVDLLPDFIAFFILARMLDKAADCAPYFEETRSSCLKLAWLSLAKIPAFMLAVFIRSKNTLDNDIFPMLALIFAVIEIILLITLIKNLASALFYLGERGSASALITPFSISKNGKFQMRPEDLRGYTVMFAVCKCLLYALPEFFLLSSTAENGTITTAPLSRFYPIALLTSLTLGFIIGGIWLSRAKRYAYAIAAEGEFTNSLKFLARAESEKKYETKVKVRSISSALFLLMVTAFFAFKFATEETEQINILPGFLFGALWLLTMYKLHIHSKASFKPLLFSGAAYSVVSLLTFIFSAKFLNKYDYFELISDNAAKEAYIPVVILSILEFAVLVVFMILSARKLYSFIYENTGLSPDSDRYGRTEKEYHGTLKKRCNIMIGAGIAAAFVKCVDIVLYLGAKTSYADVDGVASAITSSAIPWFGVVVLIVTVFFIGYTIYYSRLLKEEVFMKYSKE